MFTNTYLKQYVAPETGWLALFALLQVASYSALGRYVHMGNPGSTVALQHARQLGHSVHALRRYCVSLRQAAASGVSAFVPLTTALVTRGPRAVVPELEFPLVIVEPARPPDRSADAVAA